MAAFVTQYWDESVKLDTWFVKGYKDWHEKHVTREREALAFLKEMWSQEGNPGLSRGGMFSINWNLSGRR